MNKERIEQLALKVANTISAPFISDKSLTLFATRFLAQADAERAEEGAVAWRQETGYLEPYYLYHGTDPKRGIYEPLYLHPQSIPEEYKLVPIAFLKDLIQFLVKAPTLSHTSYREARDYLRRTVEVMLAAAHGGKAMKVVESFDQQMQDSDMIFRQITNGDFRSMSEVNQAVVMLYVMDESVSRAGISHALGRLERHFATQEGKP